MKTVGLLINLEDSHNLPSYYAMGLSEITLDKFYWIFVPNKGFPKSFILHVVKIESNPNDASDPIVTFIGTDLKMQYSKSHLKNAFIVAIDSDIKLSKDILKIMKDYAYNLIETGGEVQLVVFSEKLKTGISKIKEGISEFLKD